MDAVTQGLTGAVIGYCGFRQHPQGGRVALWTAIAAAEFPNGDILLQTRDFETYLRWHRSFADSLLLWPVWATLVAGLFWLFAKRVDFKVLGLAALAGLASHLALDWVSSGGAKFFWPLTAERYRLDWMFVLDPYLWALLALALWAAIRTQHAEVARTGLAVIAGYILFCGMSHTLALPAREGLEARAYAQPLKPLSWTIIRPEANTLRWINGAHEDVFVQYRDDTLTPQAEATDAVKFFRQLADFPLVERREANGLTTLRYRDLRWRTPLPWGVVQEGLFVTATVTFGPDGRLLTAQLVHRRR